MGALWFCRFQFEVPWVRYNAQLLTIFIYLRVSCHHEPDLKGLLRNCKTKGRPQTPLTYGKTSGNKGLQSQIPTFNKPRLTIIL